MIDSINLFMSLLSSEERIQVLAVVIGGDFDKLKMRLTSDSLGLVIFLWINYLKYTPWQMCFYALLLMMLGQ